MRAGSIMQTRRGCEGEVLLVCFPFMCFRGLLCPLFGGRKGVRAMLGSCLQDVKKGLACALTGRKIFIFFSPETGCPLLEWSAQLMV